MRRRRLGSSGLAVSRLGLGTMLWGGLVGEEVARDQLSLFVERGGTLVDTAHGYGAGLAEQILGRLLGDVVAREDVVVCTKAGVESRASEKVVDASRGTLLRQLDQSLRRLGTDYVDLWLVHAYDPSVPLAETMFTLEWAVTSGKARYVGVSNYSGWQAARAFSLLERRAGAPLVANQVEYSLVRRHAEDEQVPAALALGMGVLAWAPLGRGVLTGKYRHTVPAKSRGASASFPGFADRYLDPHSVAVTEAVMTAAQGMAVPAAAVALAWLRDRPGVTAPVVGARTLAQLKIAVDSEAVDVPTEIADALDDVSE
ncbi:MAG TPA: aldo/keto reductase [Candidatus Lustribacter sp.]|nr:aldo/keto reductase [Candidatus Lustribacter sp.]